jgi:ornithine carbamoyltransferase
MATKAVVVEQALPLEVTRLADADSLRGADVCALADMTPSQVRTVLDLAARVKARPADFHSALAHRQMALFFEKASLRTRVTFEVAMNTLGGQAIFFDQTNSPLGQRESLSDVSRNLDRWVDVIVLRTFSHQTVVEMAEHARIPVINALSDQEHPCQALADLLTLEEHLGPLSNLRIAYVGDGNNVAHSLLLGAVHVGMDISIATPKGYEPQPEVVARALEIAAETGAVVSFTNDPAAAVAGADAVYTDVWTSMGHEAESEKRANDFAPFQVDAAMMALAADHAVFMHCLPAHRGEEVSAEVLDGPQSVVFDQAENRLHAQKALLLLLLGEAVTTKRKNGRVPSRVI